MDHETKDILLKAWRENRLAAVHVDLIDFCLEDKTIAAFEGVRENAARMRALNIPNIWVTFDSSGQDLVRPVTTVAEINNDRENRISSMVEAQDSETVVIKNDIAAFKEDGDTGLSLELDRLNADTILIDGVYSSECISASIVKGILKKGYNFIAMTNGMDLPNPSGDGVDHLPLLQKYCARHNSQTTSDFNKYLATATLADLDQLLVNPVSGPIPSLK